MRVELTMAELQSRINILDFGRTAFELRFDGCLSKRIAHENRSNDHLDVGRRAHFLGTDRTREGNCVMALFRQSDQLEQ